MFKFLRRLAAIFATIALIGAALKSALNWIARSEEDDYEVFEDDEYDLTSEKEKK